MHCYSLMQQIYGSRLRFFSNSSGIRSSIGIGIDYFSVIGPINFSITEAITKESTDITESIRFNIGTTF